MSLEEAIRNSYLAQGFEEGDLQILIDMASLRQFKDGEIITQQFDGSRDLFILARGKAHILTVVGDPIAMVKPGMPIGEVSFLDERPRSVSVVSVGQSEAVVLPYQQLRDALDANPGMEIRFLRNVSRVLCSRLRSANNNIAALLAIEESEAPIRA